MKLRTKLVTIVVLIIVSNFIVESPVNGCTIFAIKRNNTMIVGNNEAWNNDSTKIWFLSNEPKAFNRAFWGFDNGWAQGGINEKGLFYDWVSGYPSKWVNNKEKPFFAGNLFEHILEKASTIDEALQFINTYNEFGFSVGRCLMADRNQAVILSWENGFLEIKKMTGDVLTLGFEDTKVANDLTNLPKWNIEETSAILNKYRQFGMPETKYSLVINTNTMELSVFDFRKSKTESKVSLKKEWNLSNHFYHLPKIGNELNTTLLTDSKAFNATISKKTKKQLSKYTGVYAGDKFLFNVKHEKDTLWIKIDSIQSRYNPLFMTDENKFSLRFIDWTFEFKNEPNQHKIIFGQWQNRFEGIKKD